MRAREKERARTGRYSHKRKQNVHALQSWQHQETIAQCVVLCHLVQSVAGIVHVDCTGKDWFIRHRRAESTAQPLLACVVVTHERGQEPVRRARTAPQLSDGSGLPIDDSQLGGRGMRDKRHVLYKKKGGGENGRRTMCVGSSGTTMIFFGPSSCKSRA